MAELSLRVMPEVRDSARANRRFLVRAIRFLRDEGIQQVLDIGTGLPTSPSTHEVAQSGRPGARIVCVDNDPVVVLRAESLMAGNEATLVVRADLRDVDSVLVRISYWRPDGSHPGYDPDRVWGYCGVARV
jgi:S-adenosyl methyltransferase